MFTLRTTPRALAVTGVIGALALGACSGDNTPTGTGGGGGGGGGAGGTFNATVTGGVTASFSGTAVQTETPIDPSTSQAGWVLLLGASSGTGNVVFIVRLGTRPGNGTYSLADLSTTTDLNNDEWGAILLLGSAASATFSGISVSGTVTITSSSANLVDGTFNIQVTGTDISNPQQPVMATLAGNFSADGSAVNFPGL